MSKRVRQLGMPPSISTLCRWIGSSSSVNDSTVLARGTGATGAADGSAGSVDGDAVLEFQPNMAVERVAVQETRRKCSRVSSLSNRFTALLGLSSAAVHLVIPLYARVLASWLTCLVP